MAGRHDERPPRVELRLCGRGAEPRRLQPDLLLPVEQRALAVRIALHLLRRGVPLPLREAVHVHDPVAAVQRVARHPDEALHERRRRILVVIDGVDLVRRLEHHHVAAVRIRVSGQVEVRERHVRAVDELVHEQPVADEQRGDHAPRRDAVRLDEERAQHEEDRDRPGERLERLPVPAHPRALLSPACGGDGSLRLVRRLLLCGHDYRRSVW